MIEIRQGIGAFVISDQSARDLDVTEALSQARDALTAALSALEAQAKHSVTFDLLANDDADFVLTDALRDFSARQRAEAEDDPDVAPSRIKWADCADRLLAQIERTG